MGRSKSSSRLPSPARRYLPALLLLFVGSGCSALVYEIVWFQLLQLVIGSTAISLGVLLGTFMGGMCLGSLLLPRLVSPARHPLRVYAALELGIGAIGLLVLLVLGQIDRIYTFGVGHGMPAMLLRSMIAAVCLLPPTLLMGATLPAIARWVQTTPQGIAWLGYFYGGNIAGAVFGCLLAGFYLLRVYDLATATYVAAAINAGVAAIGFILAQMAPHRPAMGEFVVPPSGGKNVRSGSTANPPKIATSNASAAGEIAGVASAPRPWTVHVAIALSGLCALGAEVIWTRLLSLLLGATVYTFSIILAVFLVGLGIGSSVGSALSRSVSPRLLLGACQFGLVAAMAWAALIMSRSLPYWPIDVSLASSPWHTLQLDLLRCVYTILPAACLWGASFPLALAAAASPGQDPGRLAGGVYAANTVGAILGAVGFSMLAVGWFGTQRAQQALLALSALSALCVLAPLVWQRRHVAGGLAIVAALAVAVWLVSNVPGVPAELIAYGRSVPRNLNEGVVVYVGEGMNSSVAVTRLDSGVLNFHVSGKVEASSEAQDMRLQRMLGHLPALLHPKPRSVLVVGCGAGVTAGTFVLHPDVERIVICEIEPLIPQVVAEFFDAENHGVLRDKRLEVVYDDARHYILTSQEKFDIITSDPIHPWVKGAATLYTQEYFELCKQRLNPGGLVSQWVPLYESSVETVKSEVGTFFQVFPNGSVWGNDINGAGYDVVLLGHAEPLKIDVDQLQARLDRPDHARIAQALDEVQFGTAIGLLGTYAGQASDLRPWLAGAQINRDRNLRLQYLAGLGLNMYQDALIYSDMLKHRRFPENLFVVSDRRKRLLRQAMGMPQENLYQVAPAPGDP
jgi:spermidine synthase